MLKVEKRSIRSDMSMLHTLQQTSIYHILNWGGVWHSVIESYMLYFYRPISDAIQNYMLHCYILTCKSSYRTGRRLWETRQYSDVDVLLYSTRIVPGLGARGSSVAVH